MTGTLGEDLSVLRHSAAHLMAKAVKELFPEALLGVGPAIEDGFYYDFYFPSGRTLSEEDLAAIEARMREIVDRDEPYVREEMGIEKARELFSSLGERFKVEIIDDIERGGREFSGEAGSSSGAVSVYRTGQGFVDLCRGPHVASTGQVRHFKLLRTAGAYWRAKETNPQMQRIYGTAFFSKEDLEDYLRRYQEALERDHRRLGRELDLFVSGEETGAGLVMLAPRGAYIRLGLEEFSRSLHIGHGYEPVYTPHLAKEDLFSRSGHLGWFKENMFEPVTAEGQRYFLKPMSCPMHIAIFRRRRYSYRELPVRFFELATVYRYERSGVVHGLTRLRGLTQDDAHIFCTKDQLSDEILAIMELVAHTMGLFGLSYDVELSTRPDHYVGSPADWEVAEAALREALERAGLPYKVSEGQGAFYAPKIDFHARDALGRPWQLSTIQVDLQLPARFELAYVGPDNSLERPYMIHRALFGSIERFIGILIEHFKGALPTWLCADHAWILPVTQAQEPYASELEREASASGLRVRVAHARSPLASRIREAWLLKTPYAVVVGPRDVEARTAGLAARGVKGEMRDVPASEVIDWIRQDVCSRAISPSLPKI